MKKLVVGGWLLVVSAFAMAAGMAGAAGAAGLPEDYMQVEYIESTPGAYIDTGVFASKALRAEMDFAPLEYTGDVSLGMQSSIDTVDWRFFNYKEGFIFDCGAVRVGME